MDDRKNKRTMLIKYLSWQNLMDLLWFLFLLGLLVYFWYARRAVVQTRSWEHVKGRIMACDWAVEGHRLWPKIQYVYYVDEQEYIGEHIFLDTAHHSPNSRYARQIAYKIAEAYKEGEDIDVYYNPDNPEQAVLDVAIPGKLNFIMVLLVIFLSIHLIMLVKDRFLLLQ